MASSLGTRPGSWPPLPCCGLWDSRRLPSCGSWQGSGGRTWAANLSVPVPPGAELLGDTPFCPELNEVGEGTTTWGGREMWTTHIPLGRSAWGEVGKGGAAPSADTLSGFGRWLLKQVTMQLTA